MPRPPLDPIGDVRSLRPSDLSGTCCPTSSEGRNHPAIAESQRSTDPGRVIDWEAPDTAEHGKEFWRLGPSAAALLARASARFWVTTASRTKSRSGSGSADRKTARIPADRSCHSHQSVGDHPVLEPRKPSPEPLRPQDLLPGQSRIGRAIR